MKSSPQNKRQILLALGIFIIFSSIFSIVGVGDDLFKKILKEPLRPSFLGCFAKNGQKEILSCVQANVPRWIPAHGTKAVGKELSYYEETFGADNLCHLVGHVIGENFYTGMGLSSISECSNACYSSCQHGVLAGFLNEHGSVKFKEIAVKEDLCEGVSNDSSHYKLCNHGLGHMFLLATNYQYEKALDLCGQLSVSGRSGCSSGVFMELFAGTVGGHGGIPPEIEKETRKKTAEGDIFYPCTVEKMAPQHRKDCFLQAPQRVFGELSNREAGRLSACTEYVPEKWANLCAAGIGLATTAFDTKNSKNIIDTCKDTERHELKNSCLQGAVFYLQFGEQAQKSVLGFCSLLSPEEQQSAC